MIYMLDERFCSLCYEPLQGETQRCPVCGHKTTPITLSERLRAVLAGRKGRLCTARRVQHGAFKGDSADA